MPMGVIFSDTPAQAHVQMALEAIDLSAFAAALAPGKNVLAVELHETSPVDPLLIWAADMTFTTSEPHVLRGPFLQSAASNGVTVKWRTSVPSDGVVKFGTSAAQADMTASDPASSPDH